MSGRGSNIMRKVISTMISNSVNAVLVTECRPLSELYVL